MSTWAVILAAGQGSRLAAAGVQEKKQFLEYQQRPLFWHSAKTLARVPRIFGLIYVFPEAEFLSAQETVIELEGADGVSIPWLCITGGARRQDSVAKALAALPPDCDNVLVHDAARPFASATLCNALLDNLEAGAPGVIPVLPVCDTIKRVAINPEGSEQIAETLLRSELRAVQTPQAFALETLRHAHERADKEGWDVTDDASMVERLGLVVQTVPGEERNVKITTLKDLELLAPQNSTPSPGGRMVCGWGYDVHRYVAENQAKARPMKLGGVPIQTKGCPCVQAHSDGDVLLHALTDALLGCMGQGDIGDRFPDSDPTLDNAPSTALLDAVLQDALAMGASLMHVDLTIIAQTPKLMPHKKRIRDNVAKLLHVPTERVNVKATTEEGLGFTGEKKGIKAVAMVTAMMP